MKLYRVFYKIDYEGTPETRQRFRSTAREAVRLARKTENSGQAILRGPFVDRVTFNTNRAGLIDALEGRFLTTERIY